MLRRRKVRNQLLIGGMTVTGIFLLIPSPAHADIIVPLIHVSWFVMLAALIPIVIVETLVVWISCGLTFWHTAGVTTVANLASTFIGIPIAHLLLRIFRPSETLRNNPRRSFVVFVLEELWRYPEEGDSYYPDPKYALWVGVAASLLIFVMYFVGSWLSELWVASYMVKAVPTGDLNIAILIANIASYSIIALSLTLLVVSGLVAGRKAARMKPKDGVVGRLSEKTRARISTDNQAAADNAGKKAKLRK